MRNLLSVRGATLAAATLICLGAASIAQDGESPDSLGDLVRETRAQHAATPEDKSSKAQGLVDEMQQEQEAAENAPTGFRNYNAGEYRLFVPYPYSLEGRDNGGAVLAGSRLGVTNTEVMAGTPVPFQGEPNDKDLLNAARQIASTHGQQANCYPLKQGARKTYRCQWSASPTLLGHQVWGSMEVIVGSNSLIPVMCVSPDDVHQPCVVYDAWGHNKLTLASSYDDSDPADDPAEPNSLHFDDSDDPQNPLPDLSSMRSDNPGRYPFMTFHFQEEARARLLPDERSVEWLAALKRFEATPDPESGIAPVPAAKTLLPNAITLAAKPAVVKRSSRLVDSDSLMATPAGFTRYEKGLCRDAWFCATVSVGLPGEVQISEDTPLRAVYLAKKGDLLVSIAVGPALDRRSQGLTEDEELRTQANYYLENYVWLAAKPGIGTNFSSATLDGYPGLITDFSATQRDTANIHGMLGLVLTPWGKVVAVSCNSDHAASAELQSLCEKVITSVSVRR